MLVREAKIRWIKRGEVEGQVVGPEQAAAAFRMVIGDDPREHVCVLHLDTRHGVISVEVVTVGTINQSLVHPREIFRTAIIRSATSIVIAHQHPSGDATPSEEDINTTRALVAAGRVIGIQVMDHIVVGYESATSIRSLYPAMF